MTRHRPENAREASDLLVRARELLQPKASRTDEKSKFFVSEGGLVIENKLPDSVKEELDGIIEDVTGSRPKE